MITYRDAIQIQITALQQVYDNCGGLRDAANQDEKEYFNTLRGGLNRLCNCLMELDNDIIKDRADMKLQGSYSVIVS